MHRRRAAAYTLDANALRAVGAVARPLCLDASALGRVFPSAAIGDDATTGADGDDDSGDVAIVQIRGPLAQRAEMDLCAMVDGYDYIAERFAAAVEAARAVVLVIDSPGGDGAGIVEAVRRMRALADETATPVLAYVDELAASAAYWIAAGVADAVYVPETGRVGSIGAIAVHVDMSGAAAQAGESYTLIRDPQGKAAGSALEPLDDTGRARIARGVTDLSARFAAAMAERRGVPMSAIRELDADVLQGAAAVRAGLADGVATLEQVISMAADAADKRENEMAVRDVLAQLVKAPAGASDEQLIAGARAALPIMDLGRATLGLTGANSADAAAAQVAAWKRDAEDAGKLRAEVEEKKKRKAEKKRVEAVRALSVSGRVHPAKLKLDVSREIELGNIAEPWASMPLDMLEATAGAIAPLLLAASEQQPVGSQAEAIRAGAPTPGLTDEERHVADLLGLDPVALAAHKAAEASQRAREARLALERT